MNEFDSSSLQQQQQHGQGQSRGGGHVCQCLSRISTVRSNRVVTIYYDGKEHRNGSTGIIRRKTGFEFVKSVVSLAGGLFELGLRAGDVVAIAALNSDLYLEWLLAVSFVGGIAAPLNYRWSFEEARSAMKAVEPVMLVFDESCHTWYTQLQHNRVTSVKWNVFMGADLLHYSTSSSLIISSCTSVLTTETLKKPSEISPQFDYCWAPDGIALICFTSGTTGRPKGVAITHTALIVQSLAKIAIVGYSGDDVYLHTAPLCHIGGISSGMAMLMTGACHVLIPKFEPNSALKAIEEHHVSSLITVPTMLLDLISFISSSSSSSSSGSSSSSRSTSQESSAAGGSMKKILNGGGGLSPQLIRDSTLIFPNAKLISAYGMTETCSSLTFMTLYDPALKKSDDEPLRKSKSEPIHQGVCVGKPAPHVELRISDEGSSSVGSIITRGPHVMLKYWGQTLVSNNGWIDTGDIGWIDDHGDLWLVGRSKDRIKSGGENVYPEEVESILSQHPGVSSILVIGIPDTRLSEMVVGCVRIKENWQWVEGSSERLPERGELRLSSGILQHYCKQMNLSRFKIPKIFILWSKPFPLTSTGKLKRNEVRIEAICHLQLLPSKL